MRGRGEDSDGEEAHLVGEVCDTDTIVDGGERHCDEQ